MKGWFDQRTRHKLSALGIETTSKGVSDFRRIDRPKIPPKELYDIDWSKDDDYSFGISEREKAIKLFWWCSAYDSWEWFPFQKFFRELEKYISFEFFDEIIERYFFDKNYEIERYAYYNNCSMEEARKEIFDDVDKKMYYEGFIFDDMNSDVRKRVKEIVESDSVKDFAWGLWENVKKQQKSTLEDKIKLVDEAIHLQHVHGYVFYIDIPELREEFEEEHL